MDLHTKITVITTAVGTIRIQAASHTEGRLQRLEHLLFELPTPVYRTKVGQGDSDRQPRIAEAPKEANVERDMARKVADFKARIALVSPCAYECENSEVRDHMGAREPLRAQDSVGGSKMNRCRRVLPPKCALQRQHICGIRHYFRIPNGGDAPILADGGDTGTSGERANQREIQCFKIWRQVFVRQPLQNGEGSGAFLSGASEPVTGVLGQNPRRSAASGLLAINLKQERL